jgi:hypothetical protein
MSSLGIISKKKRERIDISKKMIIIINIEKNKEEVL